MIKTERIVVAYGLPYEKPLIVKSDDERSKLGIYNIFEDSDFVFMCKDGLFQLPEYKIVTVHLRNKLPNLLNSSAIHASRITLEYEVTYDDIWIIPTHEYDRMGIPTIFRIEKQISFVHKYGVFITSDPMVVLIQLDNYKR